MMVLHLSQGAHYETYNDNSFAVFIPAVGETWRTWSQRAERVRREATTAYSEKLDGSIPVPAKLRKEPRFLIKRVAMSVYEPLVNILVDNEKEWLEAREAAFSACGYATVDISRGKPFRHPETIAGDRGSMRKDFVQESDDPVRNLAARFNGTLRTNEDIMVSTSSSKRDRINTAGVKRTT